jgi:flagellar protein FlaG
MSSESFTTAIFLITAIIAAAVLVNAFFPIIYTATGTFTKSSTIADERLRTDIKIINSFASAGSQNSKIWIKNIGSARIPDTDIEGADVFIGEAGDFERIKFNADGPSGTDWNYEILEDSNEYWDRGETLRIDIESTKIPSKGEVVYFHLVLSSGVVRTIEFTASD